MTETGVLQLGENAAQFQHGVKRGRPAGHVKRGHFGQERPDPIRMLKEPLGRHKAQRLARPHGVPERAQSHRMRQQKAETTAAQRFRRVEARRRPGLTAIQDRALPIADQLGPAAGSRCSQNQREIPIAGRAAQRLDLRRREPVPAGRLFQERRQAEIVLEAICRHIHLPGRGLEGTEQSQVRLATVSIAQFAGRPKHGLGPGDGQPLSKRRGVEVHRKEHAHSRCGQGAVERRRESLTGARQAGETDAISRR